MESSLNFHHLFYFWRIAREGGVARAAERLHLTHSTLSAQLKSLESFLGGELFERRGKRLVLTPFGAEAASYADEIFRLGAELVEVAQRGASGRRSPLRVGVVSMLPRSTAYRLIQPALEADDEALVQVRQAPIERLVEELAAHRLDLVLSDAPPTPGSSFRLHAHLLGETGIDLYGSRALARRHGKNFPSSLEDAPLLLPLSGTSLRRAIDRWLTEHSVHARVAAELDDAALLRVFGVEGRGLFPVRIALRAEAEVRGAVFVGTLEGVYERYYALSSERRIRHHGVATIVEAARRELAGKRRR